jgi:hypothetical protein
VGDAAEIDPAEGPFEGKRPLADQKAALLSSR